MKNTMFRRVVCSVVALSLSVSCFVPTAFADADDSLGTQDESSEALTGTDSIRQTSYSKYLEKYEDASRPEVEKLIKEELLLNPHLEQVCRMRYEKQLDINTIAYETGFSVAKINKDLAKIRRKISKLNNEMSTKKL